MSKESSISIPVPSDTHKSGSFSALTGEFGDGNTIFSFAGVEGSPFGNTNAEPQSRPGLQPASPEVIESLREAELIQALQENHGVNWRAHYPITEPQPTVSPKRRGGPDRSVSVDTEKVPTQVEPDAPTATPTLQEAVPTSTPREVVIPDGRIVPFADDFVVGTVFAAGLAVAGSAVIYRNELKEYKHKRIDPAINRVKNSLARMRLNYLLERDTILEALTGKEVMDGIYEVRDHMAQTERYQGMLEGWTDNELRSLKGLAKDVQEPVTAVLQAMTVCRALNEQGIPTTPTTILLLLQMSHEPSGQPGEISMRRSSEGNLILRAYGEEYSGLSSQQIAERLKSAPAREKEKRANAVERALEALKVTFLE